MNILTQQYKNLLLDFDKVGADQLFKEEIKKGNNEQLIGCVQQALIEIGNDWENDLLALSQLYMGGTITEELIDKHFPVHQSDETATPIGIVTLGDYHVLGKKILKSVLQSSGIRMTDFGQGIHTPEILKKLKHKPLKLLLVSVLMFPSALEVKKLSEAIRQENPETKIMVGGAPFNFDKELWKEVGADAMGAGPKDAMEYIKSLKIC